MPINFLKQSLPFVTVINPLNAELNPICHLLALLGGATIVAVSRLRVNVLYIVEDLSVSVLESFPFKILQIWDVTNSKQNFTFC